MQHSPKDKSRFFRMAVAVSATALLAALPARAQELEATIDVTETSDAVTPYLYGMFIEPIGGLVARSLWAELLNDRKFYYDVLSQEDAAKADEGKSPWQMYPRWYPVGDAQAVTMNTESPYVGKKDVNVALAGSDPRGIRQGQMGIAAGKVLEGRIVLAGSRQANASVTLVWGEGENDRQTVELGRLGDGWETYEFSFEPKAASGDASLEIIATGSGTMKIGAVSLMPADNIDGWRPDTTALLRDLDSGFWRLPGGNFLSNWDWHEAVGPYDKRPPMFDHAWDVMQPNDIGMADWMRLTEILEVEPYIAVDAGLGDANSAAELVDYINGSTDTYWGSKRAEDGREEPYDVRFWNIGNEPYGDWQIGKTTLEFYLIKHRRFAEAMLKRDPDITLIASGAMPDQLNHGIDDEDVVASTLENIQPKFGTENDWTGGFFREAWGTFDGINEHFYARVRERPGATEAEELMAFVRSPANQVRMKAAQWAMYEEQFPRLKESDVFLSIDEYAYTGAPANLKMSLAYSMTMQEMLRYTDFLKMGGFTMGTSTLAITPTDATLNSTGVVFKFYGEHFGEGTIPVAVTGNSPQPESEFFAETDPQVNSGSPTFPLDVVAGLSPDRSQVKIAIVNATFEPQTIAINLDGASVQGEGTVWTMTGDSLEASNPIGEPAGVTIEEAPAAAFDGTLTVPAISSQIYRFNID